MEVDVQAKVKTTKIVQGPAVDKDNVQLDGHDIDDFLACVIIIMSL